ncbi:ROK family transcriptional regulator [Humibacter ginsenosidimutans]|uniref:ROK family transcriptional regulator n=1 Tax=Humibacter ginsenosidimutans TaxID=2599293 RepID=A0A5B8M262_9MICO|nr:ROK family protein [Humibacter ginsenosidimutans]QDZ14161.1 ROK family transcriptional regulator [Humibacter ginsenosidimutans]
MGEVLAGPQGLLRAINARAILQLLETRGALARPELVSATGLSHTAVTQTLRALQHAGVVREAGVDRDRRGPAATTYVLRSSAAVGIAMHVGATTARIELIDLSGATLASTALDGHPDASDLARAAAQCLADAPAGTPAKPAAIVVGVGGIVGADRRTVRSVPGYAVGGTRLHDTLAESFGCPVTLENDVNLAALAECDESQASADDFVLLSLQHGLGSALILDGKLRRGAAGGAGEIAYLPLPGVDLGAESLGDRTITRLARTEGCDPTAALRSHLDAAAAGDPAAARLVAEIARRLALIAASITLVVEPARVVLGGDAAHPVVLDAVRRVAAESLSALPLAFEASRLGAEGTFRGAAAQLRDDLTRITFEAVAGIPDPALAPPAS